MNKNSFTKIIILAILIIFCTSISSIGVYLWQKEVAQEKEAQLQQQITELKQQIDETGQNLCKGTWQNGECTFLTCGDSDANEKPDDIYIKGSITSVDQNGQASTIYDECNGSNTQVNEGWCYESPEDSGNFVAGLLVYDCSLGCFDGACIK